jgi:hypothetical protein
MAGGRRACRLGGMWDCRRCLSPENGMVVGAEDPGWELWEGWGFLYHGFRVYDVCGARAGNVCATESSDRRAAIGWWDDMLHSKELRTFEHRIQYSKYLLCTQAGLTRQSDPQLRKQFALNFRMHGISHWTPNRSGGGKPSLLVLS